MGKEAWRSAAFGDGIGFLLSHVRNVDPVRGVSSCYCQARSPAEPIPVDQGGLQGGAPRVIGASISNFIQKLHPIVQDTRRHQDQTLRVENERSRLQQLPECRHGPWAQKRINPAIFS
jgi:hypothetical protein